MSAVDAGAGAPAGDRDRVAIPGTTGQEGAARRADAPSAHSRGPRAAAPRRVVVGITGASGTEYGVRILRGLREAGVETHLVVSASGQLTRSLETDYSKDEVEALADRVWKPTDMAAAIASGSFLTDGMVIAPCSMRTLGEIPSGVTSSLVSRAADVHLEERRRLVLVTRETPLSLIHLRNMTTVTEAGAIVVPPVPSLYTRPQTVDEILDQTVGRCLDLLGVHLDRPRWGEGDLAR